MICVRRQGMMWELGNVCTVRATHEWPRWGVPDRLATKRYEKCGLAAFAIVVALWAGTAVWGPMEAVPGPGSNPEIKGLPAGGQAAKDSGNKDPRETFEQIKKDRDNLLAQVRKLLRRQKEAQALRGDYERLAEDRDGLLAGKKKTAGMMKSLNEEIEEIQKGLEDSGEEIAELRAFQKESAQENERLEKMLSDARTGSETKKLRQELKVLRSGKKRIDVRFEKAKEKLARSEEEWKKESARIEKRLRADRNEVDREMVRYRSRLKGLDGKYAESVRTNKVLEREQAQLVQRLAKSDRQNRILVGNTASMHYNLGVMHAKKGEYKRALVEFEQAVKLRPDHAYAHYNLGHLYGTCFGDREKAIRYFKEYLRLSPKAADRDKVKRYIVTWETWESTK